MSVGIDAGRLNRRVTIQARNVDRETTGQRSTEWQHVIDAWAFIEQLQGRELEAAQAINAEITHRVTVRYRPWVTAAHRVVYQGRAFSIMAPPIDIETEHALLQLMCSEGLNRG